MANFLTAATKPCRKAEHSLQIAARSSIRIVLKAACIEMLLRKSVRHNNQEVNDPQDTKTLGVRAHRSSHGVVYEKEHLLIMEWALKLIIFCLLFLLVLVSHSYSGHIEEDEVTIVFPAVTLSKLVNGVLPLKFGPNDSISGDIWINSITNLKLEKDRVLCSMSLHGKDVKYALQIEGSSVIVEIGDVDTSLSLEGTFRFEKASNTFYLKPRVLADDTAQTDGSPMKILLSLISGIEYPIEVRKLKPIIARFSGQEIRIDSSISDIFSDKNKLFFIVNPKMVETGT